VSRTLTQKFIEVTQALATGESALFLLTIDHPSWAQPLRVVQNQQDITSRGEVFTAYAFDLTLAADNSKTLPAMQLTLDNVDRSLIQQIRALPSSPTIVVELIISSEPDSPEISFPDMEMKQISYDANSIRTQIIVADILNVSYPKGKINPSNYPGLY
jgi:hypothetical protein